jgi:hypothetical protein
MLQVPKDEQYIASKLGVKEILSPEIRQAGVRLALATYDEGEAIIIMLGKSPMETLPIDDITLFDLQKAARIVAFGY